MPLTIQPIASFLNGISQQPASQRHPAQLELQQNALSSLAIGLEKRPPTTHIAKLMNAPAENPFVHTINRDSGERYQVVIADGVIKVFDIAGVEKTVNYAETSFTHQSEAVATGNGFKRQLFQPAGDTTILLVTSGLGGSSEVTWESSATGVFGGEEATVRVDSTDTSANFVTWTSGHWLRARINTYTSGTITCTSTWTNAGYIQYIGAAADSRSAFRATTIADYTFIVNREVEVELSENVGPGTIDSTVQLFSNLPSSPPSDKIYRVEGDPDSAFDNYYVQYSTADAVYREHFKPGLQNYLRDITMPHTLIRESDGTFTFTAGDWGDREVGDLNSSPPPSFVGEKIKDVVFYRNRLGFVAGESIALSRIGGAPGGYFSFWNETVTATLDTDPIDIAMPHEKVSLLDSGSTFRDQLILFSSQAQFALSAPNALTPETAKVDVTTEFDVLTGVKPIALGTSLYFAASNGDNTTIREYFVEADTLSNDAADVTAHVPRYLPEGVFKLAGSTNNDMLVTLNSTSANTMHVYKFFWSGDEKAQSAWSEWSFETGAVIHNVDFIGPTAYLVIKRADGLFLESLSLNDDVAEDDVGSVVYLDRRKSLTGSYSAVTGLTTWTVPYDQPTGVAAEVVLGGGFSSAKGRRLATTRASATTVTAVGDFSASTAWVGLGYTKRVRLSEQFLRRNTGQENRATTAVLGGRLQLRSMGIRYSNTGYFRAEITPKSRGLNSYVFSGKVLGDASLLLGSVVLHSGTFQFPLLARSSEITIDLVNDSPSPSVFLSGEWVGLYTARKVRQ